MKSLKKIATLGRQVQKGFTLIELAIVGIFLGLLAIFAISMFSNSATDSTKGKALYEAATKVADNWGILAQSCNVSSDITATAISADTVTGTARKNFALLSGSTSAASPVVATYQACYNSSGVRPLNGATTGAAGAEKVNGFGVSAVANATVGGRNAVAVTYTNVPDNVVLFMYNTYSSASGASTATAAPATADTTDNQLRFTAPTGGLRDVTVIRPI